MSKHHITATYEREDADTGTVLESAEVCIHFTFRPGSPQTWTDPGDDPEIEFDHAEQESFMTGKPVWEPACETLTAWAEAWLEKHSDRASEKAAEDRAADRAEAMERRAEQRREDRYGW